MIQSNIKRIDEILNDDEVFEKYICQMENSNLDIPETLNKKILEKVKGRKKNIYLDIVKVAACTILAISIWNMTSSANISYATNTGIKESAIYTKFDQFMSDVNNFFMKPIRFERGEK